MFVPMSVGASVLPRISVLSFSFSLKVFHCLFWFVWRLGSYERSFSVSLCLCVRVRWLLSLSLPFSLSFSLFPFLFPFLLMLDVRLLLWDVTLSLSPLSFSTTAAAVPPLPSFTHFFAAKQQTPQCFGPLSSFRFCFSPLPPPPAAARPSLSGMKALHASPRW